MYVCMSGSKYLRTYVRPCSPPPLRLGPCSVFGVRGPFAISSFGPVLESRAFFGFWRFLGLSLDSASIAFLASGALFTASSLAMASRRLSESLFRGSCGATGAAFGAPGSKNYLAKAPGTGVSQIRMFWEPHAPRSNSVWSFNRPNKPLSSSR